MGYLTPTAVVEGMIEQLAKVIPGLSLNNYRPKKMERPHRVYHIKALQAAVGVLCVEPCHTLASLN